MQRQPSPSYSYSSSSSWPFSSSSSSSSSSAGGLVLGVSPTLQLVLLLLLGPQLLQVGLAVLVDEHHLRPRGHGVVRPRLGRWVLPLCPVPIPAVMPLVWLALTVDIVFLLVVGRGESHGDLAIEDAQGDAGDGVFEVVLGGQAVVESGISLWQRL